MTKISTVKKSNKRFLFSALLFVSISASAQITENFDNIATLPGSGWVQQNNSTPIGTSSWFQGSPTAFVAFNGATNSYIGANFNNVAGANTISNWLVAPNVTLKNGDVFTFRTRTTIDNMWADNLQVRMSTNGSSSNVGVGSAAVGDFTTLLLEINPTLALSTYPMAWTQYTIVITGLSAPVSGRIAFRYYVPNGGPSGANSDYIGIDNFTYTPYVCPTLTVTTAALANGTAGSIYNQSLTQTGALGTPTYTITTGALPPGLTISTGGVISGTPSGTGTFNFSVTVADNSGCISVAQALSITIDCPVNGASLSALPTQCSNNAPIVLSQGSPAGGNYSGTGVAAGMFDPSVGTQMITYTLIDVYGCTQVANGTILVNTAPVVTLAPFAAVCNNSGIQVLSGGSPAGGTYTGTGVTAGSFDPAADSQPITYTFTDGNSCSNNAIQTITVNNAPIVVLDPFTSVCSNSGSLILSGGSPAGGTYSGTGVTGNTFEPSTAGVFTVTYSITDVNNCTGSDSEDITVVNCLGLEEVSSLNNLLCYPNPTTGLFTIQFVQTEESDVNVIITNVEGKIVKTNSLQNFSGTYIQNFDLSNVERGIYFIEIVTKSDKVVRKIIIK